MMTSAPRLLVWRHGETDYNADGRWQGSLDVPLSVRGRQQAADAAKVLATQRIDRIVASDLGRASGTAEELARRVELPVRLDPRLREIDVGTWAGRTTAQLRESHAEQLRRLADGEDIRRGETGETTGELVHRLVAATRDAVAGMTQGETLVIATHGFAAKVLCADLIGIPPDLLGHSLRGMDNCHWAQVNQHRGRWQLAGWNLGA